MSQSNETTKGKTGRTLKGGIAVSISVILAWLLQEFGIEVPAEVQAAGATLIGSLVAWFRE